MSLEDQKELDRFIASFEGVADDDDESESDEAMEKRKEEKELETLIAGYADSESVKRNVIRNLIDIYTEFREGLTLSNSENARRYVTRDVVNYILRKHGFDDPSGKREALDNANIFYDWHKHYEFNGNQKFKVFVLLKRYVKPFADRTAGIIGDYWMRYTSGDSGSVEDGK